LPSEFNIDENGKCKIKTYINNLPKSEKKLYNNIEKLFEFVLPRFENIWSYINCTNITQDDSTDFKFISLRNRNLQVITKIVEISLQDETLEGVWHVEGMSHENIVATASCTIDQSDNFDSVLYFKRIYTILEEEELLYNMPQNLYHEFDNKLNEESVPLGKYNINKGCLIVFPNSHIHKINNSVLTKNINGKRRVIVFWLINPNIIIKSTKDIKQQKYNINKAHKHRLELMKERSYYKNNFNVRTLNLCEH